MLPVQDPVPDDDPRTSEGIYVYTHKAGLRAANASVGNAVTVRGIVAEFAFDAAGLPLTEIVTDVADKVGIGSSGLQYPATVPCPLCTPLQPVFHPFWLWKLCMGGEDSAR